MRFANAQSYAFIDSDYILKNVPEYVEAKERLDKMADRWTKEIEERYEVIKTKKSSFDREEVLLPKEEKEKRKSEIEKLEKESVLKEIIKETIDSFDQMKLIKDLKYPEQIAYLRENHGFSQAHANALVLYSRGNTTSKRFNTLEDFLAPLDVTKQKTIKAIFKALKTRYPKGEIVIAWNQPMMRKGTQYVFGASVAKNHILIAPFNSEVLKKMASDLKDYKVNKKTVAVANDWKVDEKILVKMVKSVLAQK